MAGTTLGSAYVQIIPSAQGIKGAITGLLGGEAQSAGTEVGSKIGAFAKKAIITAGIGTAVVKVVKGAMTEGAELQQNMGGALAVFGEQLYGTLESQATQAYKNMGMSASDYYATANKMGSLFQGSGISQQKSLDLTTQAMQRAADVASVMGIDTSMAMESIAGAAKGNFTMMDNLGVAMNATTLEAYALEKGLNFKWNTASNAEKAELAMKMFMDRTSQYAGNFARESDETFSGSLGAMKAAYQDFLGSIALGGNVSQSMANLATTASTFFFGNFLPMLGNIVKSIPGAIGTFLAQGLPTLISSISSLMTNLVSYVSGIANGLTSQQVASWVTTTLPQILAAGAQLIGQLASAFIINLPKIVAAIGRIGLSIVTGLGSAIWPKITAAAAGIRDRFMQPIEAMKAKVQAVVDKVKGFFPIKVGNLLSGLKLPHISISGSFSLNPPSVPKVSVDWYAKGGIFDGATVLGGIGVGEAGPEAILPLNPFWKKMDEIANNVQGGTTITVNINGANRDPRAIAEEVKRVLIRETNQRRLAWQ